MKVAGLSRGKGPRPSFPKVYSDSPPKNEIWGKTFQGEQELYDLWDQGAFDSISTPLLSFRELAEKESLCVYCKESIALRYLSAHENACLRNPYVGKTEREAFQIAVGHTHIADINSDAKRYQLGQTQPTSAGRGILESNVQSLRAKYEQR